MGLAAATLLATSAGTATTATSDSVDRVAASKSSGGKTVEELTDYCKNLVGASDDDDWHDPAAVACRADQTRHPFQIKPRSDTIVMNIRNAIPIPVRKPEERVVAQAHLKQQFPISSGQQHLDLEWIPVSGDKDRTKKASAVVVPVPRQVAKVEPPPPPPPPAIDIGAVVAQRISAVRKLQENEQDVQAQMELQVDKLVPFCFNSIPRPC